jgi:hypothetical protein
VPPSAHTKRDLLPSVAFATISLPAFVPSFPPSKRPNERAAVPPQSSESQSSRADLKDAIFTHVDNDTYISHGAITEAEGKPKVIEVTYHRVK